MVHPKLVT